ncbi:MAG: hypothetical protein K2L14_09065 [Duncaniella sp.]|nr:hypothetical protein [Duncaniella sp.]
MATVLSKLFAVAPTPQSNTTPQTASSTVITSTTQPLKHTSETYQAYGIRLCGIVTASIPALSAYLPNIFNQEKQRQYSDANLQNEIKDQLKSDIVGLEKKKEEENNNITKLQNKIEEDGNKIVELNEELESAKQKNGEVNKENKLKMIIGILILIILTTYLFIFYSSTFFSAFFRNFDGEVGVADAMFYANAIYESFCIGISQLLFIVTAPIIFMGLGYTLHYFSIQSGWMKYVKMLSILVITFIFDCILAFLIAKKIYDYWVLTQRGDFPPFNFSMAVADINVWAVIFCGFIVYVIWGIVFDMTITAYSNLRSNEKEIKTLKSKIAFHKESIAENKNKIVDSQGIINAIQLEIDNKNQQLSTTKQFNPQIIKSALAQFFAGWMTMMSALGCKQSDQGQAHQVYDTAIANLFN